jgi:uncharacterized DUF497 family protein
MSLRGLRLLSKPSRITDSIAAQLAARIGLFSAGVEFEWDDAKDLSNQRKHGLSFAEAQRLFESVADYLEIFDAEHSEFEDRFIADGPIDRGLVVVVYTERE